MEEKGTHIVVLQESTASSIIKDAFTFLLFAGLLYFNHAVLSGNVFIDILFIIVAILFLGSRKSSKVFYGTKTETIKWLSEIN